MSEQPRFVRQTNFLQSLDSISHILNLTEQEKTLVNELENVYLDIIEDDIEQQAIIHHLLYKFDEERAVLDEERFKLLHEYRQAEEVERNEAGRYLKEFWMWVMRFAFDICITERDEEILKHLIDVRVHSKDENGFKFSVDFYFEPNDYFENAVLTKTCYLKYLPKLDGPNDWDNIEQYVCTGCDINWKHPTSDDYDGFFSIFRTLEITQDERNEERNALLNYLKDELATGTYLREHVCPKAVYKFVRGVIRDKYMQRQQAELDLVQNQLEVVSVAPASDEQ